MADLIKQIDFIGKYQMTKNVKASDKFASYISKFQKTYIYKILGATFGKAFLADLDANGVPQTIPFIEIYEAFAFDDDQCPWASNGVRESIGLKEIILGLVCFELKRDANLMNSLTGNIRNQGENSEYMSIIANVSVIYNDSIASAKNVQWYICTLNPNARDFSTFNGQNLKFLLNF